MSLYYLSDRYLPKYAQAIDLTTTDYENNDFVIYVGGTGDIKVDMQEKGTVTFKDVPQGQFLTIKAKKIYRIGTSATELLACW